MTLANIAALADLAGAPPLPAGWWWSEARTHQWCEPPSSPKEQRMMVPATGVADLFTLRACASSVRGPEGAYPEWVGRAATYSVDAGRWLGPTPDEVTSEITERDVRVAASIAAGDYLPWGTAMVWGA